MMRSTLAIAGLALRTAIRSKLALCLAAALPMGLAAIPALVEGDGTLLGGIRILLVYSVGYCATVLSLATLWAACQSVAAEVAGRQILHVAVKPVRRFQVWLGKWLGLLALNAVLLAAAGAMIYGSVLWRMARAAAPEAEKREVRETVLTGRRRWTPRPHLTEAEVRAEMERLRQAGQVEENADLTGLFRFLDTAMRRARMTVRPGGRLRWVFDLPTDWHRAFGAAQDVPVAIRFHLSPHTLDRQPVTGVWHVGVQGAARHAVLPIRHHVERAHTMVAMLNREAIGAGPLALDFVNGEAGESYAAVFRSDNPVELLVRESGFGVNLIRALFIVFCKIALLAAVGLAFSAMFSFPVATFAAAAVLVAALLSGYLASSGPGGGYGHDHGHDHGHGDSRLKWAGERMADIAAAAVAPTAGLRAIEPLADGLLIEHRQTGRAALWLLILYPALLGVAAGIVLNARELGLPGE
jgi:hypothetical protein